MSQSACPTPPIGWDEIRKNPHLLQTGDLVHVRSHGLLSKLIRVFSRSITEPKTWASHSAMVLKVDSEAVIIEALSKVIERPITAYASEGSQLIVSRKPGGLTQEEKVKVMDKADDYKGRTYGYLKIAAHALDHFFNNRYIFRRLALMDKYPICSWLVAFVYDRVLGITFGMPPNAVEPDDIVDFCAKNGWDWVWIDSDSSLKQFCKIYNLG